MLHDHLEKLKHFVGVVHAGSIRGYAVKNGLSQPAVSKSIQILESILESGILIRAREGIVLTEAGRELFEWAERILSESEQIEIRVRRHSQLKLEGNFKLGTYQSIAVYFVPQFLKFLRQTQKQLSINLVTASSQELVKRLKSGELDLAISINPPRERGLTSKVLFDDTYSLYRNNRESFELGAAPIFTLPTAEDTSGKTLAAYLQSTPWSESLISCGDFEVAKAMLEAGVGFAILPERVAQILVEQKKVERHPRARGLSEFGTHHVALSFRSHRASDISIQWLSNQIEAMLKKLYKS